MAKQAKACPGSLGQARLMSRPYGAFPLMRNTPKTSRKSASGLPANHPLLVPVRTAYAEIALGMKPSFDLPRAKHAAINYELARLAIAEHIARHGTLPTWKATQPAPEWLIAGLRAANHALGEYR